MIGYYKYDKYIIMIETETLEFENQHQQMKCDKFKILHIKDILNETYTEIDKYKINSEYNEKIMFFLIEELAFNHLFFLKRQYKLFPNGYSNIYKEYFENGNLRLEFYHINGMINGKYIEYFTNETIRIECYYVDGIINGEYKEYYNNSIYGLYVIPECCVIRLRNHCNFSMGKKHGMNIKYQKKNKILTKIYYEEDIKNGYYYEEDLDNKKIIECNYKNDLLDGDYKEVDFDNNIIVKCKYDSGKIVEILSNN